MHQQPIFLRAKHPAEPTLAAEGHGRERVRVGRVRRGSGMQNLEVQIRRRKHGLAV